MYIYKCYIYTCMRVCKLQNNVLTHLQHIEFFLSIHFGLQNIDL